MGQILAIDYGERKIGLALSDETNTIAGRLPVLLVKNDDEAIEGIVQIARNTLGLTDILVGVPMGRDYQQTEMTKQVVAFAKKLLENVKQQINVITTNEVLTSKQAEQGRSKKFKKEKSDSEAARILLQEYLDHKNMMAKASNQ